MKHVGWFVWGDFAFQTHRHYQFININIIAGLSKEHGGDGRDYVGEEYAQLLVDQYKEKGLYGYLAKKSGYTKAYSEE